MGRTEVNNGRTLCLLKVGALEKDYDPCSSTSSRNSFPALKKGTFMAGTYTCSLNFGLRPVLAFLSLTRKLPKPRSSTLSPSESKSMMLTMTSVSFY